MTIDDETGSHWRPALSGCYALRTDPRTPPGEPLLEVPTDAAYARALLDPASPSALANLAPFWGEVWRAGPPAWSLVAGQYEYTPDHRPFIGPTSVPGLHVNTGYSGHGVMCSGGGARRAIDLLLGRIAERLRLKQDIPVYASEQTGQILFSIPALFEDAGQVNVMMLGVDAPQPGITTLKLQFLDPEQFRQKPPEAGAEIGRAHV